MLKLTEFKRDQNGNGILLCIFVLFFMLGVGGLVVDMSIAYKAKGEMRKAANAAALSVVREIFSKNQDDINNLVYDVIVKNDEADCMLSTDPKYILGGGKLTIDINGGENKLTVTLDKNISTYFMKIFGISEIPINVSASAVIMPDRIQEITGVVPLGVLDGTKLNVGQEYTLKVNENLGEGWFGFLDISDYAGTNSGAKALGYLIENGCPNEIKVEDKVGKITGENASVDDDVINKIVPIIIYKVVPDIESNNDCLEVTGFAYFNLEKVVNKKNIKGQFIQTVDSSAITGTVKDATVYKIKLVEK